jgi:methyltransferase-like protein
MIDKNLKPKLAKDIVYKEEGKDGATVSLASYIGGPIRILNPVASKTIKLIDGKHTIQEIITKIHESFENADLKTVEKDIIEFLLELEKEKIIEPLKK